MKKFIATLIASAAFAGAAFAAEMEATVKSYDEATRTITMSDDSTVVLAEGVTVEGLAEGAKIKVTVDDTSKQATAVEVMQ